jgi:hypothetical protein
MSNARIVNLCLKRVVDLVREIKNFIFYGVENLHGDTR